MAKAGILHDYDLMANQEDSARKRRCEVCGIDPMTFQWSDYSGEAMCTKCGCPYQLKWGNDEMKAEGNYPYLNLRDDLIEPLRAYNVETGRFTCLGTMMGPRPGLQDFIDWLKANHRDIYEKCVSTPE